MIVTLGKIECVYGTTDRTDENRITSDWSSITTNGSDEDRKLQALNLVKPELLKKAK